MHLHAAERINVAVVCEHCGQAIHKPLNWLTQKDRMACSACSADIELDRGDNGALIRTLAAQTTRLDAALNHKAGKRRGRSGRIRPSC